MMMIHCAYPHATVHSPEGMPWFGCCLIYCCVGSTRNRIATAEWRPGVDRVQFALSIPTTRNYLGFGISNDRFMVSMNFNVHHFAPLGY